MTRLQRRPSRRSGAARSSATSPTPTPSGAAVDRRRGVVHLAAKVAVTGRGRSSSAPTSTAPAACSGGAGRPACGEFVYVSSPSVAHTRALAGRRRRRAGRPGPRARRLLPQQGEAELLALAADRRASRSWRCARTWSGARATRSWSADRRRGRAPGRLPLIGSGAALIDTTYVDNAARRDRRRAGPRCEPCTAGRFVVSNGEPRPVARAAGAHLRGGRRPGAARRVPGRVARAAGSVVESVWARCGRDRRAADDQVPRRAALDRALVRPARGPGRRWAGRRPSASTRASPGSPPSTRPRASGDVGVDLGEQRPPASGSARNDTRTAVRARSATPATSRPSRSAATTYSSVEGRREHRRVVGVDGHRHAGRDQRRQRMLGQRRHRPGAHVGGRADLQRDAVLDAVRHQGRVLRGGDAVADALGAEVGRGRPRSSRGPVDSPACGTRVQPGRPGPREVRRELRARHARSRGRRGRS